MTLQELAMELQSRQIKGASLTKRAFSIGSLAVALPIFMRQMSGVSKANRAEDAWIDAITEEPTRVLVPGLETEFKQLYLDSPIAAEVMLAVR
jgi:hypothetical protein